MHPLLPAGLALALVAPACAAADSVPTPSPAPAAQAAASDVATLRREIETLRASYEARLRALEQRLDAIRAAAPASGPPAVAAAASAPAAAIPAATAPTVSAARGASAFNPAVSLILSGRYASTSRDPDTYSIAGFALPEGGEAGPGPRGFSLAESELGFAANVDPWWRGVGHFSLHADDSVSVEEAYVQTTGLDHGLSLKLGRFFSGIGYLNPQHSHAWDFVDNPLAYQALLGTQYGDDGVQLQWLAPTDQYLEVDAELGRGRSFPGSDSARNGAGMAALSVHTGGDVGDSHSWRAGVSVLDARASAQTLLGTDAAGGPLAGVFDGRTRVWIADGVWKWAPNGNGMRTNFKLQGEYLHSTRKGRLANASAPAGPGSPFSATQSGWYLQGVYQFMPRWRVGLRTEGLDPGHADGGDLAGLFGGTGFRPSRQTVMLDFSPSEFSRLRLQLADDRSREGASDRQIFLQYLMSLGAHGAHAF